MYLFFQCSVISGYSEIVKKLQEGLEWIRANVQDTREEKLEARYCVIGESGKWEESEEDW